MRRSWKASNKTQELRQQAMDKWLDSVERGRIPSKTEMQNTYGGHPANFFRLWNSAWFNFLDLLWKNTALLKKLRERYNDLGLEWFQNKPTVEELSDPGRSEGYHITPRTRKESVDRVVAAYLSSK
jgi:hypothetical protein